MLEIRLKSSIGYFKVACITCGDMFALDAVQAGVYTTMENVSALRAIGALKAAKKP